MKQNSHDETAHQLSKEHASYILITCDKAGTDGRMQVQMSYEGDPDLVSCLIDGAKDVISQEQDEVQELEPLRLVK